MVKLCGVILLLNIAIIRPLFTEILAFLPINSLLTPSGTLLQSSVSDISYFKPLIVTPLALSPIQKSEIVPVQYSVKCMALATVVTVISPPHR